MLLLLLLAVIVGIASGFLGTLLVFFLHFIQRTAYQYSLHSLSNSATFLTGVSFASPERRVLVLGLCGLIAGVGWWVLYRFGKTLVSIETALKSKKPNMPILSTTLHALLQIITVGLGSPLGREGAPREVSAIFANWLAIKMRLHETQIKTLLACGAGAGLAAVYNIPLAGAAFILEVLLRKYNGFTVLLALSTSIIAVFISWIGLGNHLEYTLPTTLVVTPSLVIWSILTSPFFGFIANRFHQITKKAQDKAPKDAHLIITCFINFLVIGCLAIYLPELLGNGKNLAQLQFNDAVGIGATTMIFLLRIAIVWSSLRTGARGGLLTPSLANGALLAVILGGLWNILWPGTPLSAFAVVGAASFLAVAQRMPITAIFIIFELTHISFAFFIPLFCSITCSYLVFKWWKK